MAKKILAILPFVIIIAAIVIMAIPRKSPIERVIDSAIDAANAHDYARFEGYVDVRALIKEYADFAGEWGTDFNVSRQAEYTSERESEVRYFIENGRIPDSGRFKNIIATQIKGGSARADLVLQIKKYSVICTTMVYLRSSSDSKWKITGFDLHRIWSRIIKASGAHGLTPQEMVTDIIFDRDI